MHSLLEIQKSPKLLRGLLNMSKVSLRLHRCWKGCGGRAGKRGLRLSCAASAWRWPDGGAVEDVMAAMTCSLILHHDGVLISLVDAGGQSDCMSEHSLPFPAAQS